LEKEDEQGKIANLLRDMIQNLKSQIPNRFRGRRRGRLLRHYFLMSVILIGGGLIASGLLESTFATTKVENN